MAHTAVDSPGGGSVTADPSSAGPGAVARLSTRQRIAAASMAAIALALLLTGVIGIGTFRGYQVALNIAGAVLMVGCLMLFLRGKARWLAVLTSWLAAFGIISEFGDFQARENDTGALTATNTTYFLPGLIWLLLFGLLALAIVVTVYSRADT